MRLLLPMLFLFASCGFETGNPVRDLGDQQNGQLPLQSPLYALPNISCQKLNQCFGWDSKLCETELWLNDSWGSFFQLGSANLGDISLAVEQQELVLDNTALSSCTNEIDQFDCSNEILQKSIVENELNNQTNIFQLYESIPSCEKIISL